MNIPKDKTVAFTGYRPEKIRRSTSNPDIESEVGAAVNTVIKDLYIRGYRYFLSGMAEGFDLWAAREVVNLKIAGECPDAELISVIPFKGQERGFPETSAKLYKVVASNASGSVVLAPGYYPECYMRRNDWLLEHASLVVCYFDGQRGGTQYTVRRARKMGLPLINLLDPSFPF